STMLGRSTSELPAELRRAVVHAADLVPAIPRRSRAERAAQ
ncbi:MAG: glutamate 5-kinase, partial [Mycolicibacterium hassiacum]